MTTNAQLIEKQKVLLFSEYPTLEEALNHAYQTLQDSNKAQITEALLIYHNTLLGQIQKLIKPETT